MGIQPRPLLRKLPDPVSLGERRWLAGAVPSPLERNPQSPRGWKNRDSDGVGLGIAVALEKAGGGESPRKVHAATAPIAIGSPRTNGPRGCLEASQLGCNARHSSTGVCGGERAQGGELRWKGEGFCCDESPSPAVAVHFKVADFLSKCHLCRKKLQGKDIYMYREKAFCTTECRYQQIVSDEYQEKFGAAAPKTTSPEIASSPYSSGQLFFTGIVVS